jgi:hypothetical protein
VYDDFTGISVVFNFSITESIESSSAYMAISLTCRFDVTIDGISCQNEFPN